MGKDPSVSRVANALHCVIYHHKSVQLFHELRLGAKDVGKFSEILARALKELHRLIEAGKEETTWLPSSDDINRVQNYVSEYKEDFVRYLLARLSGFCPECLKREGGDK